MNIEISAAELQAEQGLRDAIRATVATIERVIQERDKYRDALAKIRLIEPTQEGAQRAVEIATKTLTP